MSLTAPAPPVLSLPPAPAWMIVSVGWPPAPPAPAVAVPPSRHSIAAVATARRPPAFGADRAMDGRSAAKLLLLRTRPRAISETACQLSRA